MRDKIRNQIDAIYEMTDEIRKLTTNTRQLRAAYDNLTDLRGRLVEFELYLQYDAPKLKHTVEQVFTTFREIFRDR